jgi:hypothetical protein
MLCRGTLCLCRRPWWLSPPCEQEEEMGHGGRGNSPGSTGGVRGVFL